MALQRAQDFLQHSRQSSHRRSSSHISPHNQNQNSSTPIKLSLVSRDSQETLSCISHSTLPHQQPPHQSSFRLRLKSSSALAQGPSPLQSPRKSFELGKENWKRGKALGSGTYGKVYLGLHTSSGKTVAIKAIPLDGSLSSLLKSPQVLELMVA